MRRDVAVLCVLLAAGLSACKADDPVDRTGEDVDAGTANGEAIPPPDLQALPERTPLMTVAARGTTEGNRIVAQGSAGGALVTVVLPGGSFCQDTPINEDGPTTLRYYAMTGDGRVSEATVAEVVRDPSAPQPPSPTCSGTLPDCADEEECGTEGEEGDDENCDGWPDQCDTSCNGCTDDAYEPNDFPVNVPNPPAEVAELTLCPCRDDWFAFQVGAQTRIHAVASFVDSDIDIDMRLWRAGPEGQGTEGPALDTSAGTTDTEEIDWTSDAPGTYFLQIYPFYDDENPSGTYTLVVDD
jgi:hypothetical protein